VKEPDKRVPYFDLRWLDHVNQGSCYLLTGHKLAAQTEIKLNIAFRNRINTTAHLRLKIFRIIGMPGDRSLKRYIGHAALNDTIYGLMIILFDSWEIKYG
jgi:hypothetical protein